MTSWRVKPQIRVTRVALAVQGALALAACSGSGSALDPAGRGAERIAELFWVMTGAGVVILLAVAGLALYTGWFASRPHTVVQSRRLIVWGGVVIPTLLLAALLIYGLAMLPSFTAAAPEGRLRIQVTGEQWWWRVRYHLDGREPVDLANEVRLPRGTSVEFELSSPDVIHSFWIPPLGGKIDMIPGRKTRLVLEPTRTGVFRGMCAEYCGASHALMAFVVVVQEQEEFDRWLAQQAQPAAPPGASLARQGAAAFLANGCGACHTVRGTEADGGVGPDLTHVGSRVSLGAGILDNKPDDFQRWIAHPGAFKPSVLMPAFGMLPPEELRALAAYLESLQ